MILTVGEQLVEEIGRNRQTCEALLNVALDRDGSDNITVALLCVEGEPDK